MNIYRKAKYPYVSDDYIEKILFNHIQWEIINNEVKLMFYITFESYLYWKCVCQKVKMDS